MPVRTVDYTEQLLLRHCVEDWVGDDHPARYLRDFVDSCNLESLGFDTSYEPDGRSRIACDTLLKVWLFCYYFGIRSSRKAEGACREMMGAIWLCGNQAPDHTTLWRFWNKHHEAIGLLFKQSVRVACKMGLVQLVLHALDGTTIRSASSRHTGLFKKQLEKALGKLDERLAEIEQLIADSGDSNDEGRWALEEKRQNTTERRQEISRALEMLNEEQLESLHTLEPDARVMNTDCGRTFAWNCQAVVDESSRIVVAVDVTNEAHDAHSLNPMLGQAADNLEGNKPEITAVDTGYGKSDQEVADAEGAGHSVVTARPQEEREPYHRSQFQFDRATMELVCPQGHRLKHTGCSAYRYGDGAVERFRCTDWKHCPFASACCGKSKNGRTVEIGPTHEAVERQRQKVDADERRRLMKKRLKTVEPLFAQVKHNDGFRRFSFRGRRKVKSQLEMLGLIRNLKIMEKRAGRSAFSARPASRPGAAERS